MNKQSYFPHYQSTAEYDILAWLETIPLTRPVRNFATNFADGTLVAEIIAYFFPEYIDLDLFRTARNMSQRTKNWRLLNSNVLPKLSLHAPGTVVHDITNGDQRATELFLLHLREKIEGHLLRTGRRSRLQWETWRSYKNERHHLPYLVTPTPRRVPLIPSYATSTRSESIVNPYTIAFDDVIRVKDEEIEVLQVKLRRCETIIRAKDRRIQDLETKIGRLKLK